jgi:hypothetical protein
MQTALIAASGLNITSIHFYGDRTHDDVERYDNPKTVFFSEKDAGAAGERARDHSHGFANF